jgi:hypothetical protein
LQAVLARPAAGYFLLRRQQKVTKEKATPVCRSGGISEELFQKIIAGAAHGVGCKLVFVVPS